MKQEPPFFAAIAVYRTADQIRSRIAGRTRACRRSRRFSVSIWTIWSPISSRSRKNEHAYREIVRSCGPHPVRAGIGDRRGACPVTSCQAEGR